MWKLFANIESSIEEKREFLSFSISSYLWRRSQRNNGIKCSPSVVCRQVDRSNYNMKLPAANQPRDDDDNNMNSNLITAIRVRFAILRQFSQDTSRK